MLSAKTVVPQRRKELLRRPRLIDKLHQYVDRALTLVLAPAGYGKTSLLIDFANDASFPVSWLSLDELDHNIGSFVNYFVAALQRHFPDFGGTTRQTLSSSPDVADLVGSIVQELDNIPEFSVLILDDYHVLDSARRVNKLIEGILKYCPSHWHLIIASRTAPVRLPIVLLTAQEQVAFIGQSDLAFTAPEVQSLMQQMHDIILTRKQAEELVAVSEGWITGILLSKSSIWQGMRDVLVQAKEQERSIYSYLADQAFQQQPAAVQDTLMTLSTLHEMNDALCHQVLGLRGTDRVLQELERRGLFLTTVVDEAGAHYYRYHHLFRDFLQVNLRNQDPARFFRLHQKAAEWFEAHEQWERAVNHHLIAGNPHDAAKIMEIRAQSQFMSGKLETLIAWYEALPKPLWPEFPLLLLFAARALVDLGQTDDALPLLQQAEETFRERGETKSELFTILQRLVIWHTWGRHADALALLEEMLQLADCPLAPAAEAHRLAGAICLSLGRTEEAASHLSQSLDLYRQLGWTKETAMTYLDLSRAFIRLGRLSDGWTCQDKAVDLYRSIGPSSSLAMALNNIACERYYLAGEYEQALVYLRESLDIAQTASAPRARAFALLTTADLYRDLGGLEKARKLCVQAEGIARRLDDAILTNFALMGNAQTLLQTGDVVKALELATQARNHAERQGDVYQLGLSQLVLGLVRLKASSPEMALAEIERGRDQLEQSGARRDLPRALMLLARARQVIDDVRGALKALDQALEIGTETGTVHHLVVEGQYVFDLLKRMLRRNPANRWLANIIDRIHRLPDVAQEVIGDKVLTMQPHCLTLRFHAFGPGVVERDNEPITWISSALARYLVFYLLTHPPRSRDQIAATFWPHSHNVKSTFHWTKHQAHKALGRSLIVYEDGRYRIDWGPDCWFDVQTFESLLDRQGDDRQVRLEQAISLYHEDFLAGYDAEWCLPIRERLRVRYRDALLELARCYTDQGRLADSFRLLRRAIEVDDLYEPATQALMRLHILEGHPGAALETFRQLERRLYELDALPTQETQSLCQSILVGNFPLGLADQSS